MAMALVVVIIATQALFVKTAAFAEIGEKENLQENNIWKTAEYKEYRKENLEYIAGKYNVEPEYLYYIAKVEVTFDLEPYELVALIAQESGFVPQTRMDGGSLSYNTTQMKLATAQTAYIAITEYYKKEIPYPNNERLTADKNYATYLAGGYLRYLHDTYKNKYESYTAYKMGITGRLEFYRKNGDFKSPYAIQVAELSTFLAQREALS